jgi:hypothetical protein
MEILLYLFGAIAVGFAIIVGVLLFGILATCLGVALMPIGYALLIIAQPFRWLAKRWNTRPDDRDAPHW